MSVAEDQRERSIRNLRARRWAARRKERSKARRAVAVHSGEAATLSPREFHELSGLSLASVYRRIADNTLRHTKIGSRLLIYRDQLPS